MSEKDVTNVVEEKPMTQEEEKDEADLEKDEKVPELVSDSEPEDEEEYQVYFLLLPVLFL